MTDKAYRGRSVVVLAGYELQMDRMLSAANPGFRSRFKQRIAFPDWDAADVVKYLRRRCATGVWLTAGAQGVLHTRLSSVRARPGWANARDAEWTFDELSGVRAMRLAAAPDGAESEEAPTFTEDDARAAMDSFDLLRPPLKRGGTADGGGGGGGDNGEEAPLCREVEEAPQREVDQEREKEEERIVEVEADEGGSDGHDGISVAAALQEACVELGYDKSNPMRTELISKLVECDGVKDFPEDIMGLVCHKTKRKADDVLDELRAQVQGVIKSMGAAIFEAQQEQYKKDAPIRAKIREKALCPAGFDWHRDGRGWRCNGGSHFISNDELGMNSE